jgi:hypothetical protein
LAPHINKKSEKKKEKVQKTILKENKNIYISEKNTSERPINS